MIETTPAPRSGGETVTVASWNINGIRAAAKAGFFDWLSTCGADVVLLQEVRAEKEQMQPHWLEPFGYKSVWHAAQKKGYSGVGVLTRLPFARDAVVVGLGVPEFDSEGRFLGVIHNNTLYASVYFPNSQREGVRLPFKLAFCEAFLHTLKQFEARGLRIVVGGDFNISHTEIDLANPKQNVRNAGFLPEERAWMSRFVENGYVDTFRMFEEGGGHYTWWSNRPGVRERNIGWRLDYHFVSEPLRPQVRAARIFPSVLGSDHCPVSLELAIT